ncbi:MAG: DeoR/GlpR family DNA-binding transcription regulator [Bacteroidia bacterium]|nr:DeoR/GlpR family DNA-binding transcription regulator [Bacteroidia bacterium]
MLKEERHASILGQLRQQQKVTTLGLSRTLDVSEDTIRRDLQELAELGLLKKVHGGAISTALSPYTWKEREVYAHEEKIRLAEKAAVRLRSGQVILMDGGTTNLELARRFPQDLKATVFTNSLPVATALSEHPGVETILLGGRLLSSAQVTVGKDGLDLLAGLRADLCILGARAVHPQIGITEIDWEEAQIKRAMVQASQELMTLAITAKLGMAQPYIVAEPRKLTTLVTTPGRRDPLAAPFAALGIDIG